MVEFRPCIDIHNGKVKQIVGSSLSDHSDAATENFVSAQDASYYARLYQKDELKNGHVILLNARDSSYYNKTKEQAFLALESYPMGLQVGGGITLDNAKEFLEHGASHVIVTSYVFSKGMIQVPNLKALAQKVGKQRIVLDLSCKKMKNGYFIVTDRWQNVTKHQISFELLEQLSTYADEFLIHAVDVEGKLSGIETELVSFLSEWGKIPITYAGGIASLEDLDRLREHGKNKLNATIGSALDIFGGNLPYKKVIRYMKEYKGV